ncbi:MAG: toprim domain-containing protein, partial [bacterium]
PKMRKLLSQRAKLQWQNSDYKKFMAEKYLEFYNNNPVYRKQNLKRLDKAQQVYWSNTTNRKSQSEKTKKFFENHPEYKILFREKAEKQWQNKDLLLWRSKTTQEQWTDEFRKKRKIAYNRTYLQKALSNLHDLYIKTGGLYKEEYQKLRKQTNNKNLLRYETIKNRFFFNDDNRFRDAVVNYNHKIKRIIYLNKKVDVYDLEVKETHNFALASGVFIHNSAKQGRDRKFQAILPLFGKVLNTERARLDQIIKSDKFKNLIIAIGGGIGEQFNIDKLRYHRIIIMADADVDGSHIKCLYLTFLYRHMPEVINKGYVYVAMPPLYKIVQNKNINYFYTEEEKEEYLKKIDGKVSVQRYKGLGEMNATELWETTMNPEARILKQITVEDADAAGKMFEMLMGEEVPPRKKFIQTYAKMANLDI